jgi:hypothetical protein
MNRLRIAFLKKLRFDSKTQKNAFLNRSQIYVFLKTQDFKG